MNETTQPAEPTSADSLAWSFDARRSDPMPDHGHKNCANCLPYALEWRDRVFGQMPADTMTLPFEPDCKEIPA